MNKASDDTTRNRPHGGHLTREEQEQLYLQILDTAADGILLFEAIRSNGTITDFEITHANKKAYEIGALPPNTVGSTLLTLLPHLRGSKQFQWHLDVIESGKPFRFETSFRTAEGSEYGWFIVSLTKLGDGVVSNFVDVTQRKRAEQKIEEQHLLLQRIFETSVNGMFACTAVRNENGRIVDLRIDMINKAFTQLVGFSEEEAVGASYCRLFPTALSNGIFDLNVSVIESGVGNRKELYYKGELIDAWFDVSTSPMKNDGLLITFTEITARKRLQLELEQKVEELKRSNQSLEEFAYAASHDLQEPLRKIHFFSDRLRQGTDPGSDRADMFARMESATMRMRDLIDDLLAYSRVSVVPERFTPIALMELVSLVLQDLEASVTESGASIQFQGLPEVLADERQLRQLLQNIVGNALKYRTPHRVPEIHIRYRQLSKELQQHFSLPAEQDYFELSITDNGIGFDPQFSEKIFQVFQRLHGRSEYSGSGVGLAIARKVAVNHKGFLIGEGEPGEGATFRLFLPVSLLA